MDQFVQLVLSNSSINDISGTIQRISKDDRESFFISALAGNIDPLPTLNPAVHSLAYLWIISARLQANVSPPTFQTIQAFCTTCNVEQVRAAPERVAILAKQILRYAEGARNPAIAIISLQALLTRFGVPGSLSAVHAPFVEVCLASGHISDALPLFDVPITVIDTAANPDLHYTDALIYHYTAGMILAVVKRWAEAEEYLEIAVTIPALSTAQGPAVSALQLDALKKLSLIQLISKGKTTPLPKYINTSLSRLLRNSQYGPLLEMNQSSQKMAAARTIADKEHQLFVNERNIGLVYQAFNRAPRWAIKKLTATYLTLSLSEIGRAVGIENPEEVRLIVLSMIESDEITAQIDASDTVTFSDPPQEFTKADVDNMLLAAQQQDARLKRLEMEMSRSREYLAKAIRTKDDAWGGVYEEDSFGGGQQEGNWVDSSVYS